LVGSRIFFRARKKGEVTGDAILELLVAIAIVSVLIFFAFKIFGGYDEVDEILR
jgi:Tfp pilus assembly protein FimT